MFRANSVVSGAQHRTGHHGRLLARHLDGLRRRHAARLVRLCCCRRRRTGRIERQKRFVDHAARDAGARLEYGLADCGRLRQCQQLLLVVRFVQLVNGGNRARHGGMPDRFTGGAGGLAYG
jgi:hypothetical protein